MQYSRHWWRIFSSDFRRAKRKLAELLKGRLPKDSADCIALMDDILKFQDLNKQYMNHEELGKKLFGGQWRGRTSNWDALRDLCDWAISICGEVDSGAVPREILDFLEIGGSLTRGEGSLAELDKESSTWKALLDQLMADLAITTLPHQNNRDIAGMPLEDISATLTGWINGIDALYLMSAYNELRNKFNNPALARIFEMSFKWEPPPSLLLTLLKKTWYEGLLDEAYSKNKSLSSFNRIGHEKAIAEFKELDHKLFPHAQKSLTAKLRKQVQAAKYSDGMKVLDREFYKKRRHIPIRRLIKEAAGTIQQIKPVFMMSPMSVASYLERGAVEFDLVVFDEASQVKVADALGSIIRGSQVVVVGDTKQMPPTDFFSRMFELEGEDAEESSTAYVESILGMFLAKRASESMLRWHYRSRHDSLIAVSNREFYDNKLVIFPSPGVAWKAEGLKFKHIPDSVYDRGSSRTNPKEAKAIAEAVMEHIRSSEDLTLGVVALSTAQRDCILFELEYLRRENPECESFFNSPKEDFFVKNLENVQGDERDVIYISIGYGRTAAGRLSTNFGPLNREGGERRLNVLITRARSAMLVFCNFSADDMDLKSDAPIGVKVLKNFLCYAESGELENRRQTGRDPDSPFENEVINAIRQLGYDVDPQVGSEGFYIDAAIKDPKKPGRYILAVECDGASYHSSASARDRDRLRQTVLEGLGWRFHRVWSPDWFRDSSKEIDRIEKSIEAAVAFYAAKDEERGSEKSQYSSLGKKEYTPKNIEMLIEKE